MMIAAFVFVIMLAAFVFVIMLAAFVFVIMFTTFVFIIHRGFKFLGRQLAGCRKGLNKPSATLELFNGIIQCGGLFISVGRTLESCLLYTSPSPRDA